MKEKIKSLGVACVALLATAFCRAEGRIIWVDDGNLGKQGLTGENKALAFGSIQEAVNAAEGGATIRVLPGVYTEISGFTAGSGSMTPAVVAVNGKENLTIVAEEGPESTVIRGSYASGSTGIETATGAGAIGCVLVRGVSSFRLEGFSLERGSVLTVGDSRTSYGGAFHGYDAKASGIYMVDCAVRDCAAGWGVLYGVTAVRCRIHGNYCEPKNTASSLLRASKLFSSVVAHNRCYDMMSINSKIVNSTFADNKLERRFSRNTDSGIYNSILLSSGTLATGVTAENCVVGGFQVMGTATDDWRLISGAEAETAGVAEHLALVTVPEDCANKDLFGRKIPETGTIAAGAVQAHSSVVPAGGGVQWQTAFHVDGIKSVRENAYVFASSYPTQWNCKAVIDSGKSLTRYRNAGMWMPAEMDDSIMLMPPPCRDNVSTATCEFASKTIWVDAVAGSDTDGTGESASPYRTLQKAVDEAVSPTVVYAKPGTYDAGGGDSFGCGNRVSVKGKTVRIVGVEGAKNTFIKGNVDGNTLSADSIPGCGPAAWRCVCVQDGSGQIQGFTLIDGRTQAATNDSEQDRGGAVWYAGTAGFWVTDCVISNCSGGTYGIVRGAKMLRCGFSNCRAAKSLFDKGMAMAFCEIGSSCLNETAGNGIVNCVAYHLSVAGDMNQNPFADDALARALCIVEKGRKIPASASVSGCVFGDIAELEAGSGYESGDPLFVDSPSMDFRVLDTSPALEAGEKPASSNYGAEYWRYSSRDIDGNAIRFSADGRPMAGSRMAAVSGVCIKDADGALSVSGGSAGVNIIDGENPVVISMNKKFSRPCAGIVVNGTTNLFDDADGSFAFAKADIAGGSLEILPYVTKDWHVDAVNGVDDGEHPGFTPATAKRSLKAVLQLAASGDTVHAAPGTYREGEMEDGNSGGTYSRAVVPAGVTLVADKGPDVTVIEGSAAPDGDGYGLGDHAVRCVSLNGNSTIRGFTVRGGRTSNVQAHSGYGGGVYGRYDVYGAMKVEGCVISNCAAYAGGGVYRVTCIKCRLDGNTGAGNSPSSAAALNSALYGCGVDGNFGRVIIYGAYMVNGCTIGPANRNLAGNDAAQYEISTPNASDLLYNSVVFGNVLDNDKLKAYRCLVTGTIPDDQLLDGSSRVDRQKVEVDSDGMPVIGKNEGIDKANPGYYPADVLGDSDLRGCRRVYNGAMDIGAAEADWRERYGIVLGRGVEVSEAGKDVTETDEGVSVKNGVLGVVWTNLKSSGSVMHRFSATVTGGGVLRIVMDGEPFAVLTAADGTKELAFLSSADANLLVFEHVPGADGEGCALVAAFCRSKGLRFVVR